MAAHAPRYVSDRPQGEMHTSFISLYCLKRITHKHTREPTVRPLTPGPPELPGEQPPCGAVPGRAAEPRHGGVLQGGLLLWGGEQGHQHRGLLRHLHRVHVQV